jgi:transposase
LQVANEMTCARNTVAQWRSRYLQHGIAGLQDASRPGRPRRFSPR